MPVAPSVLYEKLLVGARGVDYLVAPLHYTKIGIERGNLPRRYTTVHYITFRQLSA
jgi:hypothetical protein